MSVLRSLLVALLAAGCGRELRDTVPLRNDTGPGRVFRPALYDTVLATVWAPHDTVLLNPQSILADGSGLWVFDFGRSAVVKLSLAGRVLWVAGRSGSGVGEFRQVRDIELVGDGSVAILDPAAARLTVIGPGGEVRRLIELSAVGHAEQVVPLPDGRFVLGRYKPNRPLAVVDSMGRLLDSLSVPWPDFRKLDALASQYLLARAGGANGWVLGLSLGSVFSIFGPAGPSVGSATYVDWLDPPRPTVSKGLDGSTRTSVPRQETARSLSVMGGSLYVLFEGRGPEAGRLIDEYGLADGRYRGSFRLPTKAIDFAAAGGVFYLITAGETPNILGLKPARGGRQ